MPRFRVSGRTAVAGAALGVGGGYYIYRGGQSAGLGHRRGLGASAWDARLSADQGTHPIVKGPMGERIVLWSPPKREETRRRLQDEEFDVLVIGGGAVGAGVAMDAQLRGMRVALVEEDDFASGTSSRSTKLIHGGIRYLLLTFQKKMPETALDLVQNLTFNKANYDVVRADLLERGYMIESAPFMTTPLPMIIPMFKWWEVPVYMIGGFMYDLLAGSRRVVPASHYLSPSQTMYNFPNMRGVDDQGRALKGSVVLYDGQQNDTRMNLHIALTAMQGGGSGRPGAAVLNHVRVKNLVTNGKQPSEPGYRVSGAVVEEAVSPEEGAAGHGEQWTIRAKQVINATGPFADGVRRMADPEAKDIIVPAKGSHLIVPDYFSPDNMGFVRLTSDGRVLYFLPWEGQTLVGTTDAPDEVTRTPIATEKEIDFCIREANTVLRPGVELRRERDVRAAWAGLRPLVRDPNAAPGDTKSLARDHVVDNIGGAGGLLSICGGKWTTYRRMAQDVLDRAVSTNPELAAFRDVECCTGLRTDGTVHSLLGSDRQGLITDGFFGPAGRLNILLREEYSMPKELSQHLVENYGTRAIVVAGIAHEAAGSRKEFAETGQLRFRRLHPKYPILEAEVYYACRHECAETCVDVIARRTRLAFLDAKAAKSVVPQVLDIMQKELGWSAQRRETEHQQAEAFLRTMQDQRVAL
eukprot:TRINITY_DN71218_c0_g1_i1.p1 TRINITY_DN71218_c0_g1~~TRINITY_DN71218_c0_g1_i1.p1  ORF type:complete len:721 (+),score=241.32 TRINITY_DN71218_c0_g1_i1:84-2165(+)